LPNSGDLVFKRISLDKAGFNVHNILNLGVSDKSMPEQGKFPPFTENPACTGSDNPAKPKDIWLKSWY
jgi:hypothetical protein